MAGNTPLRIEMVPLSRIDVEDRTFQHRFSEVSGDLAETIRQHDIVLPVVLRRRGDGPHPIVDGHRRVREALRQGKEAVPAILLDLSEAEAHALALVLNHFRRPFRPIEKANALRKLGRSRSNAAIGELLGMHQDTVARLRALGDLPPYAWEAVDRGTARLGHLLVLRQVRREDWKPLLQRVEREGLTVAQLEGLVRKKRRKVVDIRRDHVDVLRCSVDPGQPEELNWHVIESLDRAADAGRAIMHRLRKKKGAGTPH